VMWRIICRKKIENIIQILMLLRVELDRRIKMAKHKVGNRYKLLGHIIELREILLGR